MSSIPELTVDQLVILNIAQNHSTGIKEVISGHYLPQFTWKFTKSESLPKYQRSGINHYLLQFT